MATHSSILAWKIPWTEEPVGSPTAGHDWAQHSNDVCDVDDWWEPTVQHMSQSVLCVTRDGRKSEERVDVRPGPTDPLCL